MEISIHALTKSATPFGSLCDVILDISIHALTKSATRRDGHSPSLRHNFNPRTHEECDTIRYHVFIARLHFNPRTHEECDAGPVGKLTEMQMISIHALTKSATTLCRMVGCIS